MYGANEVADDTTPNNPRFIRITDIGADGELRENTFRSLPSETAQPYLLKDGDILLARSGATVGKSFIYRASWGTCCFAGYLIKAAVDPTIVCADFIYACFQADFYWRHIFGEQIQATIQNVSAERYAQLVVPCPPLDEQLAIACFLDRETTKIDALIADQEKLLSLLAEKRQATISHAITQGLNPNAPMKDSGVAWLGKVPVHWRVSPLKYLVSLRSGGTPNKENLDFWDGDIPWASAKDLKVEELADTADHITSFAVESGNANVLPAGTVLVVVRGMILARTFPVVETLAPMAINQDLKGLTPLEGLHSTFLAWLLRGSADESLLRLDEAGHGTKALRMDAWTSMSLPIPPTGEQVDIVRFLNSETAKLDTLKTEAERAIELLKERRSALIAAAVTGKVDVRNTVALEELAA